MRVAIISMGTMNSEAVTEALFEGSELEERLFEAVRQKDEAAFERLYQRCRPIFAAVIGRIVSYGGIVDEVIHETMLDVWNKAHRHGRDRGTALSWMITIARRRAIDRLRREIASSRMFARLDAETAQAARNGEYLAEHEVENRDTRALIRSLVVSLPEEQRIPVYLSYFRGVSQRDLALCLQTPLGTIKTRIELGIAKLGRLLRQFQAIRCESSDEPVPSPNPLPTCSDRCLEDALFEERVGIDPVKHSAPVSDSSN